MTKIVRTTSQLSGLIQGDAPLSVETRPTSVTGTPERVNDFDTPGQGNRVKLSRPPYFTRRSPICAVIPAKAGTQPCHSTEIGVVARLGSRFRGNDVDIIMANGFIRFPWRGAGFVLTISQNQPMDRRPWALKIVDAHRSPSLSRYTWCETHRILSGLAGLERPEVGNPDTVSY